MREECIAICQQSQSAFNISHSMQIEVQNCFNHWGLQPWDVWKNIKGITESYMNNQKYTDLNLHDALFKSPFSLPSIQLHWNGFDHWLQIFCCCSICKKIGHWPWVSLTNVVLWILMPWVMIIHMKKNPWEVWYMVTVLHPGMGHLLLHHHDFKQSSYEISPLDKILIKAIFLICLLCYQQSHQWLLQSLWNQEGCIVHLFLRFHFLSCQRCTKSLTWNWQWDHLLVSFSQV